MFFCTIKSFVYLTTEKIFEVEFKLCVCSGDDIEIGDFVGRQNRLSSFFFRVKCERKKSPKMYIFFFYGN